MENNNRTVGQNRCGVVEKMEDTIQTEIRVKTAALIDLCEDMRISPYVHGTLNSLSNEKLRLISLAQTAYQEAKMWAIEASYTI
jgi:hypothetical protein